jgi:hypothetical protein
MEGGGGTETAESGDSGAQESGIEEVVEDWPGANDPAAPVGRGGSGRRPG